MNAQKPRKPASPLQIVLALGVGLVVFVAAFWIGYSLMA